MFKLDAAEAFNYPFRGMASFLIAALLIPAAIAAVILVVVLAVVMSGQIAHAQDTTEMVKLAVGSIALIFVLVAVPGLLLMGFYVRAIRAVANGVSGVLPAWEGLGALVAEGLGSCLVGLGVTLVPLSLWGVAGVGMMRILLLNPQKQEEAAMNLITTGGGLFFLLAFIATALLAQFLLPMATLRFAMTGSVLSALNPAGIFQDIRRAPSDYVLAVVAAMGLNSVAGMVFSIVPPLMLLWLPFGVYSQLFSANLLGQYWRLHVADAR